jgi:hypothetical protein
LRLLVFLPFLISCCIVGTVQIILVKASDGIVHQFESLTIYDKKNQKSNRETIQIWDLFKKRRYSEDLCEKTSQYILILSNTDI